MDSKLLEKTVFKTSCKIGERIFLVMKDSSHEEQLYCPLKKLDRVAVTSVTVFNGISDTTNRNKIHILQSLKET